MKAATDAVAAAVNTKFPLDEVLGAELSRLISISSSVVKRHGILLEKAFVEALQASGRFEVLHNPVIPITAAADGLLGSNTAESLARLNLRYDQPAVRSVNHDLIVIDIAAGWAGAYSVKRGGGDMGPRLRKPLERDVASVRLLLRAYLRDQGYSTIDVTTSACIDWFGAAGLPPHLTVQGPDVDAHFGVPVIPTVERMTRHLREELHRAIPDLLLPLIRKFETSPPVRTVPAHDAADAACERQDEASVKRLVEAIFPIGPDAIRLSARTRNTR
ncbi:hypothetical protein MKK70_11655 [Methylobacterium sp. E-041]|jgi:hypothetical protein|nr:hypothetical protein [Methylobacterium sp. E-041]MCJ2106017.1 hypothetical protein [Methylobacterium sp. E-041]